MFDAKLFNAIEILKRKSTIPEPNETVEEISDNYDYAILKLEELLNSQLLPIEGNLDARICDILEESQCTDTFREFLVYGLDTLCENVLSWDLDTMSNLELNKLLERIDYFLDK